MDVGDTLIGLSFGLLIGLTLGSVFGGSAYKQEAIERGYALYCPNNGEWSWAGECDIGK